MTKVLTPLRISILLGGALLGALVLYKNLILSPPPLPVLGTVPDFELDKAGGGKLASRDLQGKVWIADFIFTRCSGICPLMTRKMRSLEGLFASDAGIRFVSFSVDPEFDTSEVLASYAEAHNARSGKWFFATGDQNRIRELSIQHFYLGVNDIPPGERTGPDQAIAHSSKFALIDGQSRIRGYYDAEDPEALNRLVRDARGLLGYR